MKRRLIHFFLLTCVIFAGTIRITYAADSDYGPLKLAVKINGTQIVGIRELTLRYERNGILPSQDSPAFLKALRLAAVPLKWGSVNKISVAITSSSGQTKDVTLDPSLSVKSDSEALFFNSGNLAIKAANAVDEENRLGAPFMLYICYFADKGNRNYGCNKYQIEFMNN